MKQNNDYDIEYHAKLGLVIIPNVVIHVKN